MACVRCNEREKSPGKRGYCERCWTFGIALFKAQRIADEKKAEVVTYCREDVFCISLADCPPARGPGSRSHFRKTFRKLTGAAVVQVVREREPITESYLRDELRHLGYRCGNFDFRDAIDDAIEYGVVANHRRKKLPPDSRWIAPIISTTFTMKEASDG